MVRKIVMTILSGGLYWLFTSYMVTELFPPEDIINNYNVLSLIYYVMPFLFGCVLIILIKERMYVGVLYGSLLIVVRYAISFLEITIRYPAGGNPFEATLWLFKIVGVYSTVSSTLGGILGVVLNRKVFKGKEKGDRRKRRDKPA